ncbi:hypothetical protein JMJ92_00810 [Rhodovulum visakhapatnamense]|uniref:Uncharacterized protein n=1 Tax=Rhodovulum visakhapatnamense TaxID=364297 RepID=A0ABS1RAN7_9RHOB|nr:hypothetical protein [Rhodovulum visakhapatnamense]
MDDISGSRAPALFLVDDGASMIVASTSVPVGGVVGRDPGRDLERGQRPSRALAAAAPDRNPRGRIEAVTPRRADRSRERSRPQPF